MICAWWVTLLGIGFGFSEDWLLVRGAPANTGSLTYERIGELYLAGAAFAVVAPGAAQEQPGTSRFVVGAVGENELTNELARALGVRREGDALRYGERRIVPGEGLVLRLNDPDGEGRLWWFTGADAAGTYTCFTTGLGGDVDGYVHVKSGAVLARGKHPLHVEGELPLVVRLDRQAEWLAEAARSFPRDEGALRVALGLFGYPTPIARVGYGDLLEYGRWLLGPGAAQVRRAREFFGQRELDAELRAAWELCRNRLGGAGPAPIYYLVDGPEGSTNACTFDSDPYTSRPQVLLNLPALARGRHFEAACLHESVHTLQPARGASLAARAAHEGVATALSQGLDPTLSDEDALMWSAQELAAARARHDAIARAFLARADSTDPEVQGRFMTLGVELEEVPGAPSRTAYYLAWVAARAWLSAHPEADPRALLSIEPQRLFDSLP